MLLSPRGVLHQRATFPLAHLHFPRCSGRSPGWQYSSPRSLSICVICCTVRATSLLILASTGPFTVVCAPAFLKFSLRLCIKNHPFLVSTRLALGVRYRYKIYQRNKTNGRFKIEVHFACSSWLSKCRGRGTSKNAKTLRLPNVLPLISHLYLRPF